MGGAPEGLGLGLECGECHRFQTQTLALLVVLLFNVLPVDRRKIFLGIVLAVAVFSLGWQLGMQVEHRKNAARDALLEERFGLSGSGVTFREDPEKEVDMSLLFAVWRMLDKNYVDPSALTIDTLACIRTGCYGR